MSLQRREPRKVTILFPGALGLGNLEPFKSFLLPADPNSSSDTFTCLVCMHSEDATPPHFHPHPITQSLILLRGERALGQLMICFQVLVNGKGGCRL